MSGQSLSGKVLVFDVSRCIGCRHCEIACAVAHSSSKSLFGAVYEWPRPKPRIRVYRVESYNVPLTCRHCEDAPCVRVCPTGAMYRANVGLVLHNPAKCIGCKLCEVACPIAHPRYDPELRLLIKCDLCVERLRQGLRPACVDACKTGALRLETPDKLAQMKAESILEALIKGVEIARERKSILNMMLESYRTVSWI